MCFQVHQPFRLKKYQVFDIGKDHSYFDDKKNKDILKRIADRSYLKTNKIIFDLIEKHNGKFKVAYSISGMAIEQFKEYAPDVLDSFKVLAKTGQVEFLTETYYHSLSFLYDRKEFKRQVDLHKKTIQKLFKVDTKNKVFRNTELIYNNDLANYVDKLGFKGIFAEGAKQVLGWRSPNFIYNPPECKIPILMKDYSLSDDIAFRFSNKGWDEWPLTAEKYAKWILNKEDSDIINIYVDYETFGEHQWEDTGIFDFLKHMPDRILDNRKNKFLFPSEAIKKHKSKDVVDVPSFTSWADENRDVSAWVGNKMQDNALRELYAIKDDVFKTKDEKLIRDWSLLTTSDHFYYMCTKWFEDGDVHKYFSPYESPYEAFIAFMNVVNDIIIRSKEHDIIKRIERKSVKKRPVKRAFNEKKNMKKDLIKKKSLKKDKLEKNQTLKESLK